MLACPSTYSCADLGHTGAPRPGGVEPALLAISGFAQPDFQGFPRWEHVEHLIFCVKMLAGIAEISSAPTICLGDTFQTSQL
jgi:hypothetical protein